MVVRVLSLAHPVEPVTPAELVKRRQVMGLSQQALGDMLGVPRNTVARWERGDVRIARPDWLELALTRLEARTRRLSPVKCEGDSLMVKAPPRLPEELSEFIGREAEVAECCALLATQRLVTLTGVGGIGKSRLATEVARCASGDFPQGIYLVELGSIKDPLLVLRALSTALGIAERAGDSLTDLLIEALRPQKLLLLMDDCDWVVDACGKLAYRLLRGAPCLTILATCREPLNVQGEIAWRVPPLETPPPDASFEEIAAADAVQLFVERAHAAAPWFKLTPANAPGVAYVCRRLDGIPLALELAAARMKALSVEQLIARLDPGLQLLSTRSHSTPTRQQTLRATVDLSYSLLNEDERVLFRRLSVFAGGWSFEAAERVTAGEPLVPGETLGLMERLIDKSLVICEERFGTLRQSMLDTIAEYAHERLAEAGEEDRLHRRHYDWFLDSVESIDPDELTPCTIALKQLDVDNLRAALSWSIDARETEHALRLAAAASNFCGYRGHYAEGISWLRRALDLPGAADLPQLRGKALKSIGGLSYGLGDMNAARAAMSEGCALTAADAGDRAPPLCSHLLGDVARASGDLAGALQLYQQALTEYQELGLPFWEEAVLARTASVLFEQGDYAGCRSACDQCLALGRGCKFTWATSRARLILAYLAQHDGDSSGADRLASEALAQLRAISDPSGVGFALRALSQFALERGRLGEARSYLAEALNIAFMEGDHMALARTLETIACVAAGEAPDAAAQIAGTASALRARTGTVPWPIEQERIGRWLGVGRQKIGAANFDALWAVGATLSDGEAIASARRFLDEPPPPVAINKTVALHADSPLTERQREVAALVARGLTNYEIAQQLVISPATARAHVEHVLDRLDLHSRAQVAAWAAVRGLVTTVHA